jgi:hypothetical protein
MEKVIRQHEVDKGSKWITQGGQIFARAMEKLDKEC